jgi:hypothetical protein
MGSHSHLTIIGPEQFPDDKPRILHPLGPRELRPMVRARRIALIEREVRERLSKAALDAIFSRAEVMAEGDVTNAGGLDMFVGSAMLTCDLASVGPILRESPDAGTAVRLGTLLAKDPTLAERAQVIVKREVARITGRMPHSIRGETRIRVQGTRVFLDIDVEAAL